MGRKTSGHCHQNTNILKNFLISFHYFFIRSSFFHLNTFTELIGCSLVFIFSNRHVKSQVKLKQFYFKSTFYDIISALILLPFVKLFLLPENSVLKFEQWKFFWQKATAGAIINVNDGSVAQKPL